MDFINIIDAKESGMIPEVFHPYFKDTCDYCSAPMHINYARTIMKCSNTHCYRRVAHQAASLLKDLGYKGYGATVLTDFCQQDKITNILEFILSPPYPLDLIEDLNNLSLTFPKLVEMLHIPNLGTKAYRLFEGCNSLEDLRQNLRDNENFYEFFVSCVGGVETAEHVISILEEYHFELDNITKYIKVEPQVPNVVLIEITGHIQNIVNADGRGLTKDEYVDVLNQMARKCGFEFRRSGALQSVSYIIADTKSNTRKYRIGATRQVLTTSDRLYNVIKEIFDKRMKEVTTYE